MNTRYENIGILDLRTATEETVRELGSVQNIGLIFASAKTIHLVTQVHAQNIGSVLHVEAETSLVTGQATFNAQSFREISAPLNLVITGSVVFEPDLEITDLERGLGEIVLSGRVLYPDHIEGVLLRKMKFMTGQRTSYVGKNAVIHKGKLVVTDAYLSTLQDGSSLVVSGMVRVEKNTSPELFLQKIAHLQIEGRLLCFEENASAVRSKLRGPVEIIAEIPKGFELMPAPLHLDSEKLVALKSKRLYCLNRVVLADDISSSLLEESIHEIVCSDAIVCPQALRSVLLKISDPEHTRLFTYSDELWIVDDELTLYSSRFEYLKQTATVVINGELRIDAEIEPSVLAAKISKIYNSGDVFCTREQLGALQYRTVVSEGEFHVASESKVEKEEKCNMGLLRI